MSDYIKREDAIKAMARGLGIPYTDFIDVAERCMDDISTADVVEVVRCKDCKFIRCGGDERNGILYFCSQDCKAKKSSDFCNYGERADT